MTVHPIIAALRKHKAGVVLIALQIALTLAIICNAIFIIGQRIERVNQPTGMHEENDLFLITQHWVGAPSADDPAGLEKLDSMQQADLAALRNLPVNGAGGQAQILGGLVTLKRQASNAVVDQYDIQSVVQIYAATQDRDLGAVAGDVQKIISNNASTVPKGSHVVLLGQVQTMNSAFSGLLLGLLGAVVLIYLLIVVNFQSWSDPFVIITALPAALAGIVWMLFATHTPLSVPALTGAIMCMGVATANSILVVSFCRERLAEHGDAALAALEAGFTRFRPVCMTALAMIIGMAPMALGLGEGGEQNAPLGRAVIGGLLFATGATLLFVPVVFSMIHARHSHAPSPADASGEPAYVV